MYAEIYWLTAEEGGRKNLITPRARDGSEYSFWANTQKKGNGAWSIGVLVENNDEIKLGIMGKYEIVFLVPEASCQFNSGDTLYICEGNRIIGRGVIL
jgi:hypothetical protein